MERNVTKGQASGNRCHWCGGLLCKVRGDPFQKTWDHVIPLSRGGGDHAGNKVVSCRRCNQLKGAMMPEQWQAFREAFPAYRDIDIVTYSAWIKENVSHETFNPAISPASRLKAFQLSIPR